MENFWETRLPGPVTRYYGPDALVHWIVSNTIVSDLSICKLYAVNGISEMVVGIKSDKNAKVTKIRPTN